MNIGDLYVVKKFYWFLYPSKKTAADCTRFAPMTARGCTIEAAYWSNRLNCEVSWFAPDSYVVFLEEDGKFKRILTADGKIGWIWFDESFESCFEEVKS